MKGKFLDNATKKYNSAYGKMKKGGSIKKYEPGGPTNPKLAKAVSDSTAAAKFEKTAAYRKASAPMKKVVELKKKSPSNVRKGITTKYGSTPVEYIPLQRKGGTTKMKKYQGDLSQVSAAPRMSPNEMMSTASAGPRTSTMDTGTGMKRSGRVMNRAKKAYQRAENIRKDVTGRTPNDYDIANRLYKRASRLEGRAKRIAGRGK